MKTKTGFSSEDRLAIILEGQREGTTVTCRNYNLAPSWHMEDYEFGFADESHVNKFFKRHTGVRLRSYRELGKA